VVGGGFLRVGIGAMPFLLAMLLQVGFGMSAFTAGLMTFISAAGALAMKAAAPPILRRFGFRRVLIANGVIVGLSFASYALFRPETPHLVIMLVLGVGGFFRSLQFTSLNGLTYAEVDDARLSRASTTYSLAQQLTQSVGIGLAATLLYFLQHLRGESRLSWQAVSPAFLVVAAVSLVSILWFVRLAPNAGEELNGRRRG
jgi:MFS family permease